MTLMPMLFTFLEWIWFFDHRWLLESGANPERQARRFFAEPFGKLRHPPERLAEISTRFRSRTKHLSSVLVAVLHLRTTHLDIFPGFLRGGFFEDFVVPLQHVADFMFVEHVSKFKRTRLEAVGTLVRDIDDL